LGLLCRKIIQKLLPVGEVKIIEVEAGGYKACDKGVSVVGGGAKVNTIGVYG